MRAGAGNALIAMNTLLPGVPVLHQKDRCVVDRTVKDTDLVLAVELFA